MKSRLACLLIIFLSGQPCLAQHFDSDAEFEQWAAKELQRKAAVQPAKKNVQAKQAASRQKARCAMPMPIRRNAFGANYGYRPQRGMIRSSYGYRPQRSQLLPAGYSQEMLQAKMAKLQQMQRMMGAAGGGQAMPGMPGMQGMPGVQGMPGMQAMPGMQGMQPGQAKPNFLKMLMGGGGQGTGE